MGRRNARRPLSFEKNVSYYPQLMYNKYPQLMYNKWRFLITL